MNWGALIKSKTVLGAITWAAGQFTSPDFLGWLPANWAHALAIAGTVLTVIGFRSAIGTYVGPPQPL